MREVFIRQPFFPRILNQTLPPSPYILPQSVHDEYPHNYRRVGNGAGTSDTSRLRSPFFAGLLGVNDHSLVPVIAIDHAFKGFV